MSTFKKRREMKVLIVDDFATMRRIVKNLMRENGYEYLDEAEDGSKAWPMIKTGIYDLIVSDWNMPQMSGIELLKLTRRMDKSKNTLTPFILITAEQKRTQILEAAQAGVDGYIVKPFTGGTLNEKLKGVEERYRKLRLAGRL